MDALGNRKGMDVSFWLVGSVTADGISYVSGTEAARYYAATGLVQASLGVQIRVYRDGC